MSKEIKKGIYKHFKGGEYRIVFEAKDSEDKKDIVVYQDVKDEKKIWARPREMFLDEVEVEGKKVKRFEYIKEEEKSEFEDLYKRALADYQNLLRQTAKEKEDFSRFASERFVLDVLPVYDNLKTSLDHAGEEVQKNGWLEGIKFVIKQFKDILSEMGVEEIKTVGEKFDHHSMEAMSNEETDDDKKDGLVRKEIVSGYTMKGKVIKAARVTVYSMPNIQ